MSGLQDVAVLHIWIDTAALTQVNSPWQDAQRTRRRGVQDPEPHVPQVCGVRTQGSCPLALDMCTGVPAPTPQVKFETRPLWAGGARPRPYLQLILLDCHLKFFPFVPLRFHLTTLTVNLVQNQEVPCFCSGEGWESFPCKCCPCLVTCLVL